MREHQEAHNTANIGAPATICDEFAAWKIKNILLGK